MVLSVTLSNYWSLVTVIKNNKVVDDFNFILPFKSFRLSNDNYWKEVLTKISSTAQKKYGIEKPNIIISTDEDFLLKKPPVKHVYALPKVLGESPLPLVYVGEQRGYINNIVYPLIVSPVDFYRWFNLADDIAQVENYFHNRLAYSPKEPRDNWEKGFEEALFRERLTFLFENIQKNYLDTIDDLIIAGEALSFSGDNKRFVLSFLDSLPKTSFVRVYRDYNNRLVNIQALKYFNEDLYKDLISSHVIEDLAGCLVVPQAKEILLKFLDGTRLNINLEPNSISVIPLDKGLKVEAKIIFEKGKSFFNVSGGTFGLVVDNRSRPLLKNRGSKERITLIEKWLKEINSKIDFNIDSNLKPKKEKPLTEGKKLADNEPKATLKNSALPVVKPKKLPKINFKKFPLPMRLKKPPKKGGNFEGSNKKSKK